jgi:hypothetical protein
MGRETKPVETFTMEEILVQIFIDEHASNPEDSADAPIYLMHFHRELEVCPEEMKDKRSRADIREWLRERAAEPEGEKTWSIWPLASYIHGGVVLALMGSERASTFPDQQWDVSRCGWILIPRKEWAEYSGIPEAEVDWRKLAEAHVAEWNQYLSGDVYGYVVDGDMSESCWGFYGMEAAKEAGTEAARGVAHARAKKAAEFEQFATAVDELNDLDEVVHDAKSVEASDINNEGSTSQVRYLMEAGWTKMALLRNSTKKTLDLSTAHMPSASPPWGDVRAVSHECGWVVFVPGVDGTPSDEQLAGEPDWLRPILKVAREEKALLIDFDRDAEACDDLPKWEW